MLTYSFGPGMGEMLMLLGKLAFLQIDVRGFAKSIETKSKLEKD